MLKRIGRVRWVALTGPRRARSLMWLGLAIIVVATPALIWSATRPHPAASRSWAPFCADFTIRYPSGRDGSGRYCRAVDGSDRTETTSGDASVAGIAIRNVARRAFYTYKDGRGWIHQPMVLPPGGWSPALKLPRQRADRSTRVESFEAFEYRTPNNGTLVRIPRLDNFVASRLLDGGLLREKYFNFSVGEPAPALFLPPAGQSVRSESKPGGIVYAGRRLSRQGPRED